MTTETETVAPSMITDIINTPLVILGVGDVEPKAAHVRYAAIISGVVFWMLGLMRGKAAPETNVFGL